MINSVLKAIKILEVFEPNQPRISLTEISRRLDLPKSTTHNLLNTLLSVGYIEKVSHDQYSLGTAIVALTQSVRINVELRDRAAPLLRQLADQCHESVYLTNMDIDQVLYIYAVESPQRLLARSAVGERAHLHCTAVGKAILAYLPQDSLVEIVERQGLPRFTEYTICDFDGLVHELAQTRERGYSIDNQEHERNTYCIGAPIFNADGQTIASCSISGIDPQIIGDRMSQLSQMVTQVSLAISQRMGFVPATLNTVPHLKQP